MKSNPRSVLTALGIAVLAVLAPILLYFAAALIGALVPANPDWREPEEGVLIFIRTNGVHTWLMLPAVNPDRPSGHERV